MYAKYKTCLLTAYYSNFTLSLALFDFPQFIWKHPFGYMQSLSKKGETIEDYLKTDESVNTCK